MRAKENKNFEKANSAQKLDVWSPNCNYCNNTKMLYLLP